MQSHKTCQHLSIYSQQMSRKRAFFIVSFNQSWRPDNYRLRSMTVSVVLLIWLIAKIVRKRMYLHFRFREENQSDNCETTKHYALKAQRRKEIRSESESQRVESPRELNMGKRKQGSPITGKSLKHHTRHTSNYGVRWVSQIEFTMSDSFLVFFDYD